MKSIQSSVKSLKWKINNISGSDRNYLRDLGFGGRDRDPWAARWRRTRSEIWSSSTASSNPAESSSDPPAILFPQKKSQRNQSPSQGKKNSTEKSSRFLFKKKKKKTREIEMESKPPRRAKAMSMGRFRISAGSCMPSSMSQATGKQSSTPSLSPRRRRLTLRNHHKNNNKKIISPHCRSEESELRPSFDRPEGRLEIGPDQQFLGTRLLGLGPKFMYVTIWSKYYGWSPKIIGPGSAQEAITNCQPEQKIREIEREGSERLCVFWTKEWLIFFCSVNL